MCFNIIISFQTNVATNLIICFQDDIILALRLTLGAEAWSWPIRRIEAASFLANLVLFSSCLQRGKFLVREGLKSV